ncbi:MAG: hypothetical protein PHT88_05520 [Candidatus Moranbacteria bacterium]|nr:hypothetical protein [Candidatus Moranbacteria bacterium]
MQKQTNTKILIAVPMVLLAALAYVLVAKVLLLPQDATQIPYGEGNEEEIPVSQNDSISEEENEIVFNEVPDMKVMKRHVDDAYAYDFTYKGKTFGHVDLMGDWRVEHFLSYGNGSEYFGFSMSGSGIDNKYYWGPTMLYKANTAQGSLVKVVDFSLDAEKGNGDGIVSNSWGTDLFITDISEDEKQVVYCNYWTDNNKIFIKDIATGKIKEFSIDGGLYDFGDAMLSEDGKKIAFAGVKTADGTETSSFVEADLFLIDVATGNISLSQSNKTPGYYAVNGWQGNEVDYEYVTEE